MTTEQRRHLMATFTCHDCGERVHSSEALLRSINFQRVAFCRNCWELNHSGAVPAPRVSTEDAPTHQTA